MTDDQLARVRKAGRKYARAQAARDAALADLLDTIRQADDAGGVTRQDLIRAAGVGRQTVYDALRKPSRTP